jgi:hypothetical protein
LTLLRKRMMICFNDVVIFISRRVRIPASLRLTGMLYFL